jgi:hypothetical protein
MAIRGRDDQTNHSRACEHFANSGPFPVARAGGLQAGTSECDDHRSRQNHLFHIEPFV